MDMEGVRVLEDLTDGLVDRGGGGNGRVAQGVIKYILFANDGCPQAAVFKQIPDAGAVGTQSIGSFVVHCDSSRNGDLKTV